MFHDFSKTFGIYSLGKKNPKSLGEVMEHLLYSYVNLHSIYIYIYIYTVCFGMTFPGFPWPYKPCIIHHIIIKPNRGVFKKIFCKTKAETHLLSSNGCRAVRFEQTAKFSLLRLLMMRGLLSKHSCGEEESDARETAASCSDRLHQCRPWVRPHLTEEHEHAHVELQQPGDAERPPLGAAQRVEQQLSAQRALPLLGPHVDLLLAVRKRAVLPVLALLALLHLCVRPKERTCLTE